MVGCKALNLALSDVMCNVVQICNAELFFQQMHKHKYEVFNTSKRLLANQNHAFNITAVQVIKLALRSPLMVLLGSDYFLQNVQQGFTFNDVHLGLMETK